MPKITEARRSERRQQVLEAARRSFERNGFQATTIDDICAEAGLSPGAVYTHFASKRQLIEALTTAECEWLNEALERSLHAGMSVGQLLAQLGVLLGDESGRRASPAMTAHLWSEAARDPEVAAIVGSAFAEPLARLAEIIRAGQARGEVDSKVDPVAVARVVLSIGQGLVVQSLTGQVDLGACVEVLRSMAHNELLRPERSVAAAGSA